MEEHIEDVTDVEDDSIDIEDYNFIFIEGEHIPQVVITSIEESILALQALPLHERYQKHISGGLPALAEVLNLDTFTAEHLDYLVDWNNEKKIDSMITDILNIGDLLEDIDELSHCLSDDELIEYMKILNGEELEDINELSLDTKVALFLSTIKPTGIRIEMTEDLAVRLNIIMECKNNDETH